MNLLDYRGNSAAGAISAADKACPGPTVVVVVYADQLGCRWWIARDSAGVWGESYAMTPLEDNTPRPLCPECEKPMLLVTEYGKSHWRCKTGPECQCWSDGTRFDWPDKSMAAIAAAEGE